MTNSITPTPLPTVTLNGVEQPKRIWLLTYRHEGDICWSAEPNPDDADEIETVEYVRADLAVPTVAHAASTVEALEFVAQVALRLCDAAIDECRPDGMILFDADVVKALNDALDQLEELEPGKIAPADEDAVLSSLKTWITGLPHDLESRPQVLADLELVAERLASKGADEGLKYWERPFGDAGDAIDFACDHAKEPVFFLEDWRKDGAREWPEYLRWLKVQQEGAKAAALSKSNGEKP